MKKIIKTVVIATIVACGVFGIFQMSGNKASASAAEEQVEMTSDSGLVLGR